MVDHRWRDINHVVSETVASLEDRNGRVDYPEDCRNRAVDVVPTERSIDLGANEQPDVPDQDGPYGTSYGCDHNARSRQRKVERRHTTARCA